jgi:hypothetical protein
MGIHYPFCVLPKSCGCEIGAVFVYYNSVEFFINFVGYIFCIFVFYFNFFEAYLLILAFVLNLGNQCLDFEVAGKL